MKTGIDTRVLKLVAVGLSLVFALLACENPTGSSSENGTTDGPNGGGDAGETTFQIGGTGQAGGIVFYVDEYDNHDWTYLEVWTENEVNEDHQYGNFKWEPGVTFTRTGERIGTGYANTYTALAGPEYPAAEAARNASHGGYTDWFLPSKDEIEAIWLNLVNDGNDNNNGIGGFSDRNTYWSSSQYNRTGAWTQQFNRWSETRIHKDSYNRVRVVRAF